MVYQLLDSLPDDTALPSVPTQLWLLITLEIVISDDYGEYLLLTHPSYSFTTASNGNSGIWTPPFVGIPVPIGYSAPETVGSFRRAFSEIEKCINFDDEVNRLAYVLGLPSPRFFRGESFSEIKYSPRSCDSVKGYRVIRYHLESIGPRGRLNLADPECCKGYVFLPLRELNSVLSKRHSAPHRRDQTYYLGKPLASNLEVILNSEDNVKRLQARAISLERTEFFREERGLLIAVDLAGYGTVCKYAQEKMHSFEKLGPEIAGEFRETVARYFYRMLAATGVYQVHMAGDGFICALSETNFPEKGGLWNAVVTFFDQYEVLLQQVATLNSFIPEVQNRVGSRIALHFGQYRYGRIAQALSFGADFDGASIIEVARLEAALREHSKGSAYTQSVELADTGNSSAPTKQMGARHLLVCSDVVVDEIRKIFRKRRNWKDVDCLEINVKESKVKGQIFEYSAPALSNRL